MAQVSASPLLYKYGTLRSQYAEALLSTPSLWFATAACLNDPFEIRPVHTVNGSPLPDDISADLNEDFNSHAGICCLSRTNSSILMWSYYADSHAGFCLGFDATEIAKIADLALPVDYQEKFPALEFLGIDLDHLSNGVSLRHMTTKFEGWAHEEEVRLISLARAYYRAVPVDRLIGRRGPGPHSYPAELLRSVTFGARMMADDRARVRHMVESRGHAVEFNECAIVPAAFKLNIVKVDDA